MWDLWWTKWHWGRFSLSTSVSLPIRIPPIDPQSSSSIIWGCYNKPNSGHSTKWTQSDPMRKKNEGTKKELKIQSTQNKTDE
jgi:hypothetical protein